MHDKQTHIFLLDNKDLVISLTALVCYLCGYSRWKALEFLWRLDRTLFVDWNWISSVSREIFSRHVGSR